MDPTRRDEMTEYVLGFMFGNNRQEVLLIRKNRPDWQAGKLNGIGGKVEAGELPYQAMIREFEEEAGVPLTGWNNFGTMRVGDAIVYLYSSFESDSFDKARSMTDEEIERVNINTLSNPCLNLLPNLLWLVPMAAHSGEIFNANITYWRK
jgi:8-oxo-dGTP diphosphatase